MKRIEQIVLQLLDPKRADEELQTAQIFSDRRSFKEALAFAESLHAAPTFAWAITQTPYFDDLPEAIRNEVEAVLSAGRMKLALFDAELDAAASVLDEAGIEVIVLKGMDVGRRFYPTREARRIGDVDLLVRKFAYPKAWSVLTEAGFKQLERRYSHSFRSSVGRTLDGPSIDLHHGLIEGDTEADMETLFRGSVPGPFSDVSPRLRVLCPEDCLIYLLRHSAVLHALDTPVWCLDLHYLICRSDLDWDFIMGELKRARARAAAAIVFELLCENWKTHIPERVRYELKRELGIFRRLALPGFKRFSSWFSSRPRGKWWLMRRRYMLREGWAEAMRYGFSRWKRLIVENRSRAKDARA